MNQSAEVEIQSGVRRAPTVVFVAALKEEARSILDHLENVSPNGRSHRGHWFHFGTFQGTEYTWDVGVAECGPGNTDAGHFVHAAVECFDPDYLMFSGIAGGLKDVSHCDVVAATKVYLFQSGKDDSQFLPRPRLEWGDIALQSRARFVGTYERWKERVKGIATTWDGDSKSIVAPLAAGEVVVASDQAPSYEIIRQHYSDAVAVEMEGYGFLSACRSRGIPGLVVRGISDLCHDKGDADREGIRHVAAAHAAAFSFEVLADIPPHPRFPMHPPSDGEPPASEPDPLGDIDALVQAAREISEQLRRFVPKEEIRLRRPEERELEDLLLKEHTRVICLLGAPGAGKTSLLAQLLDKTQAAGHAVLGLKADLIHDLPGISPETTPRDTLVNIVETVARNRRFYLFVDQLDAVADLADLRSDRLNWLLDLIRAAAEYPTVTVVCSSRRFEFEHDARLAALDCEKVVLSLPEWEVVSGVLESHGVAGALQWPEEFRHVLSSPQHLTVFLRLSSEPDLPPFSTYHQMLEEWWRRDVQSSDERVRAVAAVTDELVTSESLWCPEVRIPAEHSTITQLVAAGILRREGGRIGFSHQSILEYARARSFVRDGTSLSEHVFKRQDAVFVRPTIWSTLTYLRGADRDQYHIEIERLLSDTSRLHVRYLLVEFLGALEEPNDREIAVLLDRLDNDEDRTRVLIATRGRVRWFNAMRTSLPFVLRWSPEDRWYLVPYLNAAWGFARDQCLDFIERYLFPAPALDDLTYRLFLELGDWDERAVALVERLIRRAPSGRVWWAEAVAGIVSADTPALAPRVVATVLQKDLEEGEGEGSVFEDGQSWYEVSGIAEAAPCEFLSAVWPVVVSNLNRLATGRVPSTVLNLYPSHFSLHAIDEDDVRYPLLDAVRQTCEQVAREHPEHFLAVTRSSWDSEAAGVHTLLVLGFAANPAALGSEGLDYFRGDPRRGSLGHLGVRDEHYSRLLISSMAGHLSEDQIEQLVAYIRGWTQYRDDAVIEGDQFEWDREARLRLLTEIPESRRSSELEGFIESEITALPEWEGGGARRRGRVGRVRTIPPASAAEMAGMTADAVLDLYDRTPEGAGTREWVEEPGGWREDGGRDSLVRELADGAKEDPEASIRLIPGLLERDDQVGVSYIVEALARSEKDHQLFFDAVMEHLGRGQWSETLRSNVSRAIHERCVAADGLPDAVIDLLETWLGQTWSGSTADGSFPETDERSPESVLWGGRRGIFPTVSSFWTLAALTQGLLRGPNRDSERWMSIVETHLERESSIDVWRAYCPSLERIRGTDADRDRGIEIAQRLFERFPAVRCSVEGVHLVATIWRLFSRDYLRDHLLELHDSEWSLGKQSYAELLTFCAFADREWEWGCSTLDEHLDSGANLDAAIALGIGFAASRLWEEFEAREQAASAICRLIPHATEATTEAIQHLFWASDDFPADESTNAVLQAIANNPNVLAGRAGGDLAEHLVHLLPRLRQSVLDVSRAMVDHFGAHLGSFQSGLYVAAPHLVDIAFTLQRYPETRSAALDMFERMLRFGIDVAYEALNDIDLRPISTPKRESPRRRRHRRKPRVRA